MQQLNADWFIEFSSDVASIPAGTEKLVFVYVAPGQQLMPVADLQAITAAEAGATWYISGEPNIKFTVDDMVEKLHYYYTEIKTLDPTARLTSPSMLNWDFTCIGCGGYPSGETWMKSFIARYQDLYGTYPEWDLWAIDLYPIDWWNLPNTGFEAATIAQYAPNTPPNSEMIPAKQMQGYRQYIDSLPGKSGQPIIVTELGLHVGWSSLEFGVPGCPSGKPSGEYKPLVVRDYFDGIFTWLEDNAVSHNIERWFTFLTYSEHGACKADGYAGMSLLDSPSTDAQLTDLGKWYVSRSAP
jgi:hypothetical protein